MRRGPVSGPVYPPRKGLTTLRTGPARTLLLTRPEAASWALARDLSEAAETAGVAILISPLLSIRFADVLPPLAESLIFTSRAGVAAYVALGGPPGLPVWCVGPCTAADAAAHGLDLRGQVADAASLAAAIPDDAPSLLHLRGAVQRGDLAADLRARGLRAGDAVVYAQDAVPLSGAARDALLAGPVIVPLYSPRSAALFAAACPEAAWPHVAALALSPAVAAALPVAPETVAARPDGAAMRDLLRKLLRASAVEGGPGCD